MNPHRLRPIGMLRAGLALLLAGIGGYELAGNAVAGVVIPDSLKNHPDYGRPHDPESLSVVIGRRTNAPLVSMRFTGGAKSLDDLGRRICSAIQHDAMDSLMSLCVTEREFRVILWREFPQSRPATGLQWSDAWTILAPRLHAGCSHAIRDYGGHAYTFMNFDADSVAQYKNFKLYSQLRMEVRDERNEIEHWSWLKAIAERKGSFKIYSTED